MRKIERRLDAAELEILEMLVVSCDETLCLELLQRNLGFVGENKDVPSLISHDELAEEAIKMQLRIGTLKGRFE